MRTLLLAGAAIVSLAGLSAGAVHAADIYEPAPNYSVAPPAYEPPPPPVYRPAPRYGYVPPAYEPPPVYAPPRVYGPPPAVAYEDDEEVIVAPRRHRYRDYAEHSPYRNCWWQWGERRCGPRRGW